MEDDDLSDEGQQEIFYEDEGLEEGEDETSDS